MFKRKTSLKCSSIFIKGTNNSFVCVYVYVCVCVLYHSGDKMCPQGLTL